MKISYNWLKWYVPDVPGVEELWQVFKYHLCEVEGFEKKPDGDIVFDINILPNRAHDLLSHRGIAREIASLLNISYIDPTPKYKVPASVPTKLVKTIETPKCRRYMGRIIRNVKIGPSPDWVVQHLESIGQRSINNIVDATNIVMFDCGQPTHVFDLNKIPSLKLMVRDAKKGEKITILGGGEKVLNESMMIIADDDDNALDVAGVKGGKYAELTNETTDIILEAANFDPVSVRKTAQALNIVTDAKKRFENDLSPELAPYGMLELSALIYEMCPDAIFEDIVDVYPIRQAERSLTFSAGRISKILGLKVEEKEIEEILKRYNFEYKNKSGVFEITVPMMRLDLVIEEDMAEEVGRILGYDKVHSKIPKISFEPKINDQSAKISWARRKLLADGYSEVMTYTFSNKGEVEVMQSASDKKFLRTNISDGLKESIKLNQFNLPLLNVAEVKIFEIGTVFKDGKEEVHVAYGDKKEIQEASLEEFISKNASPEEHGYFSAEKFLELASSRPLVSSKEHSSTLFAMWSPFPFIARDIAVLVDDGVGCDDVCDLIKENMGDMVVRGPELFDEFEKDGKTSYAHRLVFQSFDRTLTDAEINEVMNTITQKIKEKGWQVR